MQIEHYQNYKVTSVMSEPPEAYISIAVVVVWICKCFTLNLSSKLQKHIFTEVNELRFNSSFL